MAVISVHASCCSHSFLFQQNGQALLSFAALTPPYRLWPLFLVTWLPCSLGRSVEKLSLLPMLYVYLLTHTNFSKPIDKVTSAITVSSKMLFSFFPVERLPQPLSWLPLVDGTAAIALSSLASAFPQYSFITIPCPGGCVAE